jgi:hypothetical protein
VQVDRVDEDARVRAHRPDDREVALGVAPEGDEHEVRGGRREDVLDALAAGVVDGHTERLEAQDVGRSSGPIRSQEADPPARLQQEACQVVEAARPAVTVRPADVIGDDQGPAASGTSFSHVGGETTA